jgi:hypothetical protein
LPASDNQAAAVCNKTGPAKPMALDKIAGAASPQPTTTAATFTSIEKLGKPAPTGFLSTLFDSPERDIKVMMNKSHIVVHCESTDGPEYCYAGVYTLSHMTPLTFVRDSVMTNSLRTRKDLGPLERLGFCLQFQRSEAKHILTYQQMMNGSLAWCLRSELRDEFCVESRVAWSQDYQYWDDPMSLLCSDSSFHYGDWIPFVANRPQKDDIGLALTPFDTLEAAIELAKLGPPRISPPKYKTAFDYSAWNVPMVLLADRRNCQAPLEWIDSLTGVFTPIVDTVMNGYPVWKKDAIETARLVDSIPTTAKECLNEKGISLSSSAEPRILCVCRDARSGALLLTLANEQDIDLSRKSCSPILQAHFLPNNIDRLLSVENTLFSTPDESFSTWSGVYHGKSIQINVAFTPREYFEETVSLAASNNALGKAPLCDVPAKKKKKRKKPSPHELSGEVNASRSEPTDVADHSITGKTQINYETM